MCLLSLYNHPSPSKLIQAEGYEGRRDNDGVAEKDYGGGCSHDERKHRARSCKEGVDSTQESGSLHTTAMGNNMCTADEQGREARGGDDTAGKGKSSAQDGRREGRRSSEGVGVTQQPESPGSSAVGEVVPAYKVRAPPFLVLV